MNSEKRQILQMLSEGKISVDDAERLLAALGEDSTGVPEQSSSDVACCGKPKFLHVQVKAEPGSHHGHENVNIKIPIMLLKAGLKLGSVMPEHVKGKFTAHLSDHGMDIDLNKLDSETIDSLIKALSESSIQVDSDKERVNIYCA